MPRLIDWIARPRAWVEMFALANLSFLTLDIYFAHSVNSFQYRAEWIPFIFSIGSALAMIVAVGADLRGNRRLWAWLGAIVGGAALCVGIAGMLLHLESGFFEQQTIKHLVYTAPFVAPLAYTGLGLLLIMNRMVSDATREWGWWVTFFAMGGFAGNFVLSLADHAQNGFYFRQEWIAVIAGAIGFAFLLTPLIVRVERSYFLWCAVIMLAQVGFGMLGFYYHVRANLSGAGESLWDRLIYGAPIFAPLLFPNLALLALVGLWVMATRNENAPIQRSGRARDASTS